MLYDVGIIGCGISGAAIAFELSKYDLKIAVFEKENDVACGATKANSAIIHAGYDPKPGTMMGRLNARGSALCREICERLDVPYKNCGALVAAFNDEEVETLKTLLDRGKANGVPDLRIISGEELFEMEPLLSRDVVAALYAPTSSIVSPWEYCLAMAETAVKNGADMFLDSEIESIEKTDKGYVLRVKGDDKKAKPEYQCRYLVNAAGVFADKVHDMACSHDFDIIPVRGQYYLMDRLEGKRALQTIFCCPNKNGKGVLVSPTVHGNLIVGPDSETVEGEDKSTTSEGLDFVKEAACKSVPSIDFRYSIRNFAGVRARTKNEDFIIQRNPDSKGFIDAAGICSPGLSAAPAIAEYVAELLSQEGLCLKKRSNFIYERRRIRFKELSPAEKQKLVSEKPEFGKIVCRCETITEGEILECFNTPIPPRSVDGVKRRVSAGMGRCQGGFCGPTVVELLAKHFGVDKTQIVQEGKNSFVLAEKIGGSQNV